MLVVSFDPQAAVITALINTPTEQPRGLPHRRRGRSGRAGGLCTLPDPGQVFSGPESETLRKKICRASKAFCGAKLFLHI